MTLMFNYPAWPGEGHWESVEPGAESLGGDGGSPLLTCTPAHHWCHELCFMQNDKVQTKNYQGDREASEYRLERQPRRNLDLLITC